MCGIAGYYGEGNKKILISMLKKIKHRGPDGDGIYVDNNIGLGNVRLSIVDLKGGKQPIFNEDRNIVVVFNGEIYNHKSLKKDLIQKGHKFRTRCDTEVLVHLYEEYGDSFLNMLNGMFAFAIWDINNKKIMLARDRIGIKPLYFYYSKKENRLIFGSEIKSIIQYPGLKLRPDTQNLHYYLYHGFSMLRNTPIQSIKKLLPGELLILNKDSIKLKKYWEIPSKIKKEDYYTFKESTSSILEDSVNKRKMGDVPVSVFLSGGLDSSTITSFISKNNKSVNTFSIGFGESTDELKYAKTVAEYFNTNHNEIFLDSSEIRKALPKIIYHLEEPVADFAVLPFYFLSREAGKKFKVGLLGEGSDEIFGGYSHYPIFSRKMFFLPCNIRQKIYNKYRRFFNPKKLKKFNLSSRQKQSFIKKIRNPFYDAQHFDLKHTLPGFQLLRVDKLSMAHSLECRVPFLDHRLVSKAIPSPEKYKLNFLKGKKVLYDIMKKKLPSAITQRRKKPFAVPINKIFKKEIKENYISLLEEKDIFNFISNNNILKYINENKLSPRQTTLLFFYSLWGEIFLENKNINKILA